jgi:hypothetical protein
MLINDLERVCSVIDHYDSIINDAGEFKQPLKEVLSVMAFLNTQYIEKPFLGVVIAELCAGSKYDVENLTHQCVSHLEKSNVMKNNDTSGYFKLKPNVQSDMQLYLKYKNVNEGHVKNCLVNAVSKYFSDQPQASQRSLASRQKTKMIDNSFLSISEFDKNELDKAESYVSLGNYFSMIEVDYKKGKFTFFCMYFGRR